MSTISYRAELNACDYAKLGHISFELATTEDDPDWRGTYAQVAINMFTTAMSKGSYNLEHYVTKAQRLMTQ